MTQNTQDESAGKQKKPWYRVLGTSTWYFFNSLKLTLSLLLTLAVVSILGTVIQQGQPIENYITDYGEKWTRTILYLQLDDMYHSVWYVGLLATVVLNIIVCTFERFPPKWRFLKKSKAGHDPNVIENITRAVSFPLNESAGSVGERVLVELKKRKYKCKSLSSEGRVDIYGWRGVVGRYGSDAIHVSLILILFGAILGSIYGYKDFKVVHVGDTFTVQNVDFELRLDKFWIEYYDTGQIKQYNSLLTVVEGGKDVLSKHIWVNEPLFYKGIRFYQSSYGMAWNKIEVGQVALKRESKEEYDTPIRINWHEKEDMPNSPYAVKVVEYVSDFAFDEVTKNVYSKSVEANNPALHVQVYRDGELVSEPWLFLKYPGLFSTIPGTDDDLVFVGYKGTLFSGLSVNKDPGTNVVWFGTSIMGFGFILAFFVFHRRIWVKIENTGSSSQIKIGGIINKNNLALEKELKELAEVIKAGALTAPAEEGR